MTIARLTVVCAAMSALIGLGGCTLPFLGPINEASTMDTSRLPIIGDPAASALHTESVRLIKTINVKRIAIMPAIEVPDLIDKNIADGAAETLTAELYTQMAIQGGWDIVPESDVTDALQKLPPSNAANLDQNALALGRDVSADAIVTATVERYKERVGLDYAAQSPAAVTFTLQLVDRASGKVVWTAKFAKSQKALTENIFNLVSFVQVQGRWVKAHEIAMEGVTLAVNDLHSQLNLQQNVKRFEPGSYEQLRELGSRYDPNK